MKEEDIMKLDKETKDVVSRRGFIKTTAIGVGATVLSGLDAEESGIVMS
jgi:hypothetical protein